MDQVKQPQPPQPQPDNSNKIRIPLSCVKIPPAGNIVPSPSRKEKVASQHIEPVPIPIHPLQFEHPQEEKRPPTKLDKEERRKRIEKYLLKKQKRKWSKEVVYYSRQKSAEKRVRVCGRFVNKATEIIVSQRTHEGTLSRKALRPGKPHASHKPVTKAASMSYTGALPAVHSPIFAYTRTTASLSG